MGVYDRRVLWMEGRPVQGWLLPCAQEVLVPCDPELEWIGKY